ncbi:Integrase/recombinase xerD [Mycena sanguinolenta]|uniref:Integrase/recombinase xerD n=1 Tax=Mycena sanguinolenta TaxID=230812 RepID=A0A8H6ZGS0_9AGAR|nr:Integrase/recombinase xerD [Mycena sanguinolenta]
MSSPFVRITGADRQRSKHFVRRVHAYRRPVVSARSASHTAQSHGLQPLLIRESDAPETPSTVIPPGASAPRSISAPAPSPLLLSNESAAHRFLHIPHSVLFPGLELPNLRPNTDPCANSVPLVSPPSSTASVSTHLRRDAWEFCLRDYPDRSFVDSPLHIIDHGCDIGFTGPRDVSQACTNLRSAFKHPEAVTDSIVSKTEVPSTRLEMLGIELDSIAMEACLPAEKLTYLSKVLHVWREKTHCSLRELQEFTGYLIFCSQVIRHSCAFLQSLFDFAASFKSPYSRRRLSRAARRDISWWSDFTAAWNGIHIISPDRQVVDIYTDASGTKGAGGIYGSH